VRALACFRYAAKANSEVVEEVELESVKMQSVPKIVRDRLQAPPPAANHPDADLLTAFAEQSLAADERATVLAHLARCGDCREVVALALPPIEMLETAARPMRSAWLTWPVLRWGFVAAGVVIVASIGVLQLQKRSANSAVAVDNSPSAQVARNEAHPQLTAALPAVSTAKQDTATFDRLDEAGKATSVTAEAKAAAPAPPPSSTRGQAFHGIANGSFGGAAGGPKAPSQFQNNYNVQQQTANGLPAPTLNQPGDQFSSAKKSAGANGGMATGGASAAITDTEGEREARLRDQSQDSQLFSDKTSVSKTKLPVTQPAPGQIAGHVFDSSGAAVPNARITVTPATVGETATAVTDSQGAFLIAGLPTGNYKAQAQAAGFNTTVLDLSHDASRPSAYNFILNVGSVSETVEVAAQSALLQTETSPMAGPVTVGSNYAKPASNSSGLLARWTVSAGGALQRSFDQGKSWQTVNVNSSLMASASPEIARESRAKDVPKENEADKKLLKREIGSPVFRAVTVAGSEVWAGGSGGALYHSLDAGNHWTRVVPSSAGTVLSGDIISLEFSDSKNGKVTTSTPEVWTTNDAGQTWQKQ
jgi:hypothetical protein